MDERLKHSESCDGMVLPKEEALVPGSSNETVHFPYLLLKDPEDHKKMWKPDVFIDQAIRVRWSLKISQTSPNLASGCQGLTMPPSPSRSSTTASSDSARD